MKLSITEMVTVRDALLHWRRAQTFTLNALLASDEERAEATRQIETVDAVLDREVTS